MYNFEFVKENDINKFEVKDHNLTITSYDKSLNTVCEVKIDGLSVLCDDKVIFLGKKQTSVLKALFLKSEGTLEIENNVVAKTSVGKYRSEFILEETNSNFEKNGNPINVSIPKLKVASKFVSKDSTKRVILTGVHIEANKIIGCDSFKLYETSCECDCNVTIPTSFIDMLEDDMSLEVTKNSIIAKSEYVTLYGKLIEGNYPDTSKLTSNRENNYYIDVQAIRNFISMAKNIGADNIIIKDGKIISKTLENALETEINTKINCAFNISNIINVLPIIKTCNEDYNVFYKSEYSQLIFNSPDELILILPIKLEEGK